MSAQVAAVVRQILKSRGTLSLVTKAPHDPVSYYQSRTGLWVWDGFRSEVVASAKLTAAGAKFDVSIFELVQAATAVKIEKALSANHFFDESAICAVVADLIEKQPNGESGDLESTGYANLFYTRACVVELLFDRVPRVWRTLAWHRDNIKWDVGRRVLAPVV
jgi:hypothetical protein